MSASQELANRLKAELGKTTQPSAFTQPGFQALVSAQDEYVEDLAVEAIRVARRSQADVVSKVQVDEARSRVRSASKRFASLELFGGLLGGAGISQLVTNLSSEGEVSTLGYGIATALTVVGVAMLVAAIVKR